jgi:uncharacterized membrane protein
MCSQSVFINQPMEYADTMKKFSLLVQAIFYIVAGINHFRMPRIYLRIIPPQLPNPELLNYVSGAAEVLLGLLLLPKRTRSFAAKGIIALLFAVYPANIYQMVSGGAGMKVPQWALVVRLPLQFVLMAWAWWHMRDE